MKAAVFLDRDGVICEHRPDYVKTWGEFRFLPGALDALRRLASHPGKILVVSNQSCIGRGLVSKEAVDGINRNMESAVRRAGGRIDGMLVCPHRPDDGCLCRKPSPGMLMEAAREHGLGLDRCWMVGDNLTDVQMGLSAGCRTILVRTGLGEAFSERVRGDSGVLVARDLDEASEVIIRECEQTTREVSS